MSEKLRRSGIQVVLGEITLPVEVIPLFYSSSYKDLAGTA
jgi:hypothetical protein